MTPEMMIAKPWMFVGLVVLALVYEAIALYQQQGNTISEILWRAMQTTPLVSFAMGVVCGHLVWQATQFWRK